MWTTIAVVILALSAVVLFTPLELTIRCEWKNRFRCRLGFRWLFGLVEVEPDLPRAAESASSARRPQKKRRRATHVMAMLGTRGFLVGLLRLARRLRLAVRIRDLFVWLRAGFDDPADTGLLCAWLMPAAAFLEAHQPGHWDVAPVFSAPTFGMALRGRLSVTLAGLLWPFLAFGLSPGTIRGFVALRTGRYG